LIDTDGFTGGAIDILGLDADAAEREVSADVASADAGDADGVQVVSAYRQAVLADMPLLYLRLGEKSGNLASDESGNGKTGIVAGLTFGAPGPLANDPDTAVTLDGTSGLIDLGKIFDFLGNDPFSLELWMKPDAGSGFQNLLSKNDELAPGGRQGYSIFLQGSVNLSFERVVAGVSRQAPTSAASLFGVWSHLVAVYDGSTLWLYVNGIQASQTSDTRALGGKDVALYLGCFRVGSNHLKGSLDEVAIYGSALPAERIRAHYLAAQPPR
jgi:hypothetical protein